MRTREKHRSADVYGINRDLPLNYVERAKVDPAFIESLSRDKHVVVFGSSKQGKTSLRKNTLQDDDCITVSCLNTMSLDSLHGAILKAAGFRLEQSTKRSQSGSNKTHAEFTGKGKVPFIGEVGVAVGMNHGKDKATEIQSQPLELELRDVNDVIQALEGIGFDKFVVLEDFHYLPVETQKNFSFALKSFHENSQICFIVIGVWREKNRLEYYNGDLSSRVVSIDADEWTREELARVVEKGEALLNVKFDQVFLQGVMDNSHDAVYLIQEACLQFCQTDGVFETCDQTRIIGSSQNAQLLIEGIVASQAGRYTAFINNFAEGFQKTPLEMYKWLMYSVLLSSPDQLERGLRRSEVSAKIKEGHPEGKALNEGNITQALQNAASLQIQKSVRPIVLDYDETTKVLHVVDKSFLIWLAHQDKSEIYKDLGILM